MDSAAVGQIHSHETFGALDGPGLRYVLFLQGCGLRCLYCHNPDTWRVGGKTITAGECVVDILRYRNFIRHGGVTLSGGEPLLQPAFVQAVCEGCRVQGLHTAIDTSGAVPLAQCRDAVDAADLILLDIKAVDAAMCAMLTGRDNRDTLALLDYCESVAKPVWIRQVVVPGYTLADDQLSRLGAYLAPFRCVRRVELLPFHKMGFYKWQELGKENRLADTPEPSDAQLAHARQVVELARCPAHDLTGDNTERRRL